MGPLLRFRAVHLCFSRFPCQFLEDPSYQGNGDMGRGCQSHTGTPEWDHGTETWLAGGLCPCHLWCGRLKGFICDPALALAPAPPLPSSPFLAYEICMENRCPCSPTPRPPPGPAPAPSSRGGSQIPLPMAAWLACLILMRGGEPGPANRELGVCVCISIYIHRAGPTQVCMCP